MHDEMGNKCPFCPPIERETEWIDPEAWFQFNVFRCRKHGQFMIVARHHGDWYAYERELVKRLRDYLFPGKQIRWEMASIKSHAHCHIIGT